MSEPTIGPDGIMTLPEVTIYGTVPGRTILAVTGIRDTSPEFRRALCAMCDRLGANPDHIATVMCLETGTTFNPAVRNAAGSGAVGLIQFMASCLSDDTEILTAGGWKTVDDLTVGEAVVSYCQEKDSLELDNILELHIGESSDCVRMHNKQFDFIATRDHRWYCKYNGRPDVLTTGELSQKRSKHKIVRAAKYHAGKTTGVSLSVSLSFLELLGTVVGDGSIDHKRSRVRVYQSEKAYPQLCANVDRLIYETGLVSHRSGPDKHGMIRWDLYGDNAREILAWLEPKKRLKPGLILGLSQDQLHALLSGYVNTDGSYQYGKYIQFTQVDPGVMSDFQTIAFLMGSVCNVYVKAIGGREHVFPGRNTCVVRDSLYTNVKVSPPLTEARANRMNYSDVAGLVRVWCPVTRNGTWVARRNGKITITGNTAKALGTTTAALAAMSAVEQLAYVEKYFAPYRGRLSTLERCYLAVFMPALMNKPMDHVVARHPSKVYEQNKGFDRAKRGWYTVGDICETIRRVEARAKGERVSVDGE